MPNKKHYYVIYLKSPFSSKIPCTVEYSRFFCVVEDEDIAKDFCQKNPGFDYYEDIVELHCRV